MIFNVDGDFLQDTNSIAAPKSLKNVKCDFVGTGNLLVIHKD